MMADIVPGTDAMLNVTRYAAMRIDNGTFLKTVNCFDENHPAQEITFMCSDSVAMSSIATAASHALTTCMTSENTATVNNAQPRTVLRDASVQQVLNISVFRVESARWPDGPPQSGVAHGFSLIPVSGVGGVVHEIKTRRKARNSRTPRSDMVRGWDDFREAHRIAGTS